MKMNNMFLGILVFAMFAVIAVPAAVAQNEVYLIPQDNSATYGNTADVEIWVNATELGGGQINLTYDSACADITNWVLNTTNFLLGTWDHYDGREWIMFSTWKPQPANLTGEYMVGTLTIQCVNASEGGCGTPLAFDMADPIRYCALFDESGNETSATWINGTFSCSPAPPKQPYVVSSDDVGKEKNSFNPSTDNVYCYAGNLTGGIDVDIYVVENKTDWVVGALLEDVTLIVETNTTNASGGIWPPVEIWHSSLTPGQYDIVIDVNRSGTWDVGEPIDSWTTTGFDVIPEFTTIAIPIATIIGLFMLIRRRRKA